MRSLLIGVLLAAIPLAAQADVTRVTETLCKRTRRAYICETRSEVRMPKPKPVVVAEPPKPYVPPSQRIEGGIRVMRGMPQ